MPLLIIVQLSTTDSRASHFTSFSYNFSSLMTFSHDLIRALPAPLVPSFGQDREDVILMNVRIIWMDLACTDILRKGKHISSPSITAKLGMRKRWGKNESGETALSDRLRCGFFSRRVSKNSPQLTGWLRVHWLDREGSLESVGFRHHAHVIRFCSLNVFLANTKIVWHKLLIENNPRCTPECMQGQNVRSNYLDTR